MEADNVVTPQFIFFRARSCARALRDETEMIEEEPAYQNSPERLHHLALSSPLILLKNPRSSFESLRMNGGAVEIIGDFPFMLS